MIGLSILLALAAYIWLARFATRRITNRTGKYLVIALFVLIPTWDIIPGKLYFNHLCATEAGVKVYRTVELPAEYWDAQGKAKFLSNRGIVDIAMLGNRFQWNKVGEPQINWLSLRIDKDRWQLTDKQTEMVLGEKISFTRYFGWLSRFSQAPNVAESCRNLWIEQYGREVSFRKENSEEMAFSMSIFKQTTPSK